MKRIVPIIALALAAMALGAQQVTKVGICDFSRVLNTSYRESKSVREFYEAQQTIKKEQATIEKEIADLENQRLEADKEGKPDLVLQLDKRLSEKRRYLEDYRKINLAVKLGWRVLRFTPEMVRSGEATVQIKSMVMPS